VSELDAAGLAMADHIAAIDPNLVKQTKRAINRAFEAQNMLTALEEALAIDLAIEGAGSPDKIQFMEIARRDGLKAALAWRDAQAEDDPSKDPYAAPNRRRTLGVDKLPTNQGVFVGSYATVAGMLDELAAVPGVRGVMLTFDDFIVGMEQFGTRILPLMRCRGGVRRAA